MPHTTVRGQNPLLDGPQTAWADAAAHPHASDGSAGTCPNGYCGNGCPDGWCDPCTAGCRGYGWRPHHHHTFRYRQPRNLVYPPNPTPAAIVQYPYYTVKGPDDFFLQ